jgi:carbonic anhydrase
VTNICAHESNFNHSSRKAAKPAKKILSRYSQLNDGSVVLREMIDKGEIGLVGAMYDVSSGKVISYE